MDIKTKFGINDIVFTIGRNTPKKWIGCTACEGTGRVVLKDGKERTCPECYAKCGSYKYEPEEWMVGMSVRIGQVTAKVINFIKDDMFDNVGGYAGDEHNEQKNEYMAYETGIGSGRVWYEDLLFSTKEEAEKECFKRNRDNNFTEA